MSYNRYIQHVLLIIYKHSIQHKLKPFTDKVIKERHVLQSVTNSIIKSSNEM